ncbi:type VII secretion-associated protein [Mycolicibacterium litorale]|uniref:Type VII secretion-associated protein n=1 Tax=Mycolicibacterium litorale TaxID=758802 RepID=A0A6S6P3F3_9MYCO|nr:type VII secretion-associated protein [Mycolicibacterium litorale]
MTVVEVGPTTIRGPGSVDDELAEVAVESIDDTVMLVDDRPVAVRSVIADLIRSAAGSGDAPLTVVHPSWWSGRRVGSLLASAHDVDRTATVATRAELFGGDRAAVVEIAADHVAVVTTGICTITRCGDDATCAAVLRELPCAVEVFVDLPPLVGGDALVSAIVAALRDRGVSVTRIPAPTREPTAAAPQRPRRWAPVLAGALLAAVCLGAAAVTRDTAPAPGEPTALLVEGRVGVVVPALWTAHRITEGAGSARVQITSPSDPAVALHVTQSVLPRPQTLEQVADALRDALQTEDGQVFTDFRAADQRGGRAAATYRERRAKHQTEWAVLADGPLRIAIGCQSPPGRADAVRAACEAAVHSAHAVF